MSDPSPAHWKDSMPTPAVTAEEVDAALDQWFSRPDWRTFYEDGPDVRGYMRRALVAARAVRGELPAEGLPPSRGGEALDRVVDEVAGLLHWLDPHGRGVWPTGPDDDGMRAGRRVDLAAEPRLTQLRSHAERVVDLLRGRLAAAGSVDLHEARLRVGALLEGEASVPLVPGSPHADGYAEGVRDALEALGRCGPVPAGSPLVATVLGRLARAMRPFADIGSVFAFARDKRDDEVAVRFDTGGGLTRNHFIALHKARSLLLSGMPRDTAYEAMVTAQEHWECRALAAEAALKVSRAAP